MLREKLRSEMNFYFLQPSLPNFLCSYVLSFRWRAQEQEKVGSASGAWREGSKENKTKKWKEGRKGKAASGRKLRFLSFSLFPNFFDSFSFPLPIAATFLLKIREGTLALTEPCLVSSHSFIIWVRRIHKTEEGSVRPRVQSVSLSLILNPTQHSLY